MAALSIALFACRNDATTDRPRQEETDYQAQETARQLLDAANHADTASIYKMHSPAFRGVVREDEFVACVAARGEPHVRREPEDVGEASRFSVDPALWQVRVPNGSVTFVYLEGRFWLWTATSSAAEYRRGSSCFR